MALVNGDKYLKIENVDIKGNIAYAIYASLAHRLAGDTEFMKALRSNTVVTLDMSNADPEKSIADNLKTAGYLALKGQVFTDWVDALEPIVEPTPNPEEGI